MPLKKLRKALKKAGKSLTKVAIGIMPSAFVDGLRKKEAPAEQQTAPLAPEPTSPQRTVSTLEQFSPKEIMPGGATFFSKEDEEENNLAGMAGKAGTATFKKGGMVKKPTVKKPTVKKPMVNKAIKPSRSVLGVGCAKRGFGKALMKGR